MVENIIISRAVSDDLKDILALQKSAFNSEAALCNDFTIEPNSRALLHSVRI